MLISYFIYDYTFAWMGQMLRFSKAVGNKSTG